MLWEFFITVLALIGLMSLIVSAILAVMVKRAFKDMERCFAEIEQNSRRDM